MRSVLSPIVCVFVVGTALDAAAYPSSVVYIPSAEATRFGTVSVGGFSLFALSPKPGFSVGAVGLVVGVAPSFQLAGPFHFGGVEVSPTFAIDGSGQVAGAFSAKVQLLADREWVPAVAVGVDVQRHDASARRATRVRHRGEVAHAGGRRLVGAPHRRRRAQLRVA